MFPEVTVCDVYQMCALLISMKHSYTMQIAAVHIIGNLSCMYLAMAIVFRRNSCATTCRVLARISIAHSAVGHILHALSWIQFGMLCMVLDTVDVVKYLLIWTVLIADEGWCDALMDNCRDVLKQQLGKTN